MHRHINEMDCIFLTCTTLKHSNMQNMNCDNIENTGINKLQKKNTRKYYFYFHLYYVCYYYILKKMIVGDNSYRYLYVNIRNLGQLFWNEQVENQFNIPKIFCLSYVVS